jgi:hypothetical protein
LLLVLVGPWAWWDGDGGDYDYGLWTDGGGGIRAEMTDRFCVACCVLCMCVCVAVAVVIDSLMLLLFSFLLCGFMHGVCICMRVHIVHVQHAKQKQRAGAHMHVQREARSAGCRFRLGWG